MKNDVAREALTQDEIDKRARAANNEDLWNKLWDNTQTADWRRAALNRVHTRIERSLPDVAYVIDIGGGQGDLAARLQEVCDVRAEVWDHSQVALTKAAEKGVWSVRQIDLEEEAQRRQAFDHMGDRSGQDNRTVIMATELLEHLTAEARTDILQRSRGLADSCFWSVPNARLAPEEEHQHTIEFDAVTLLAELRAVWGDECRVAALGPYLLGICGRAAAKPFKLSMCLPVRNEEADLEKVLASFREVADEIVVGIDPRSDDGSREIAERYAEAVFDLVDPAAQAFFATRDVMPDAELAHCRKRGLLIEDPVLPPEGVHFAWVRNQCMRHCTGEWIFMTEGHERLIGGYQHLMNLHRVVTPGPNGVSPDVVIVARQGNRQQWGFPWLCKNDPDRIHYIRGTHNTLEYPPEAIVVKIGQILTLHERDHDNAMARAEQRQAQNRDSLQDDWERTGNANSLFYLGQETRRDDPDTAAEHLETYLGLEDGNGLARYQARLMLAKIYSRKQRALRKKAADESYPNEEDRKADLAEADRIAERCRAVLMGATADDWSRSEHWVWLGDLAFADDQLEQALMFYRYAGTLVEQTPFGPWWVDLDLYGYLPAQRLAMCYGHLGRGEDSLLWAKKVYDLLPETSPAWAFEEARTNIRQVEEALAEMQGIEAAVM